MEKLLAPLQAATILGVSLDTLNDWIYRRKIKSTKTLGGHHRVPESEIVRLISEESSRRDVETLRGYAKKISEENQLIGRVLEVKFDGLVAQVNLAIGKHRLTSIISADAAHQLQLKPGEHAVALFKSTEVMILRL